MAALTLVTVNVRAPILSQDVIGQVRAHEAVAELCGHDVLGATAVDRLLQLEPVLADSLRRHRVPADSGVWRLACIRTGLAEAGTTGRPSYLMPVGTSWRQGATELLFPLVADDDTGNTAELVAAINHDPVLALPPERLLPVYVHAIEAGRFGPLAARACVAEGWRAESPNAVRKCAQAALTAGTDSTFHLLAMAELRSMANDTTGAWQAYVLAIQAVTDSASKGWLTWHLRWFLSPRELAVWDSLPIRQLPPFAQSVFTQRDIRDGRAAGATLMEHFARLEVIRNEFDLHVLPINRSRLLSGAALSDASSSDRPRDSDIEIKRYDGGSEIAADVMRDFSRWQTDFDDRGAVWMRFGPPTERNLSTAPAGSRPFANHIKRETWRYDIDGGELLLSFESEQGDGSEDATRLVSGVVGEHFCGIDARRCFQGTQAWAAAEGNRIFGRAPRDRAGIGLAEMGMTQHADRVQIREATTKDDNSERFPEHLTLSAHLHRVWDPTTGRELGLVPWAVRVADLETEKTSGGRENSLTLALEASAPSVGSWWDSTTTRHLRLPDRLPDDAQVTGVLEATLPTDITAWSLVARQGHERGGRVFNLDSPPLEQGPLVLSDLIVGAKRQGLDWRVGVKSVPLAPLGIVDHKAPVSLYFQIRSAVAHDTATIAITVSRTDGANDKDLISVAFASRLGAGLTEVQRELGAQRLDPGRYMLRVRVTTPDGLRATRSTPLYLR